MNNRSRERTGYENHQPERADEALIEAAEKRAREEHTTLDEEFRRWLAGYTACQAEATDALERIERIQSYAKTGGQRFTRDEMNERAERLRRFDQAMAELRGKVRVCRKLSRDEVAEPFRS